MTTDGKRPSSPSPHHFASQEFGNVCGVCERRYGDWTHMRVLSDAALVEALIEVGSERREAARRHTEAQIRYNDLLLEQQSRATAGRGSYRSSTEDTSDDR